MAKPALDFGTYKPFLRERCKSNGWALCIGAGTSGPMFPGWPALVEELVRRDPNVSATSSSAHELTEKLLKSFSPDAVIQAAQHRLSLDDSGLRSLLVEKLYGDLRTELSSADFQRFCNVLAAWGPVGPEKADWIWFMQIVRNKWPTLSALQLAKLVVDSIRSDIAPSEILTFNAEPLLYALVNGLLFEDFVARGPRAPNAGELRQPLDFVTHQTSSRRADRIPYVFCHGLLPVPDPSGMIRRFGSEDKLVFSESEYLDLAGSVFSWQSSSFLHMASTRHVVFVGVSLTDANMRRWLSWVQRVRAADIRRIWDNDPTNSAPHYWITLRPSDDALALWTESAVAHLGVRVVWIRSWDDVGPALRALLGL